MQADYRLFVIFAAIIKVGLGRCYVRSTEQLRFTAQIRGVGDGFRQAEQLTRNTDIAPSGSLSGFCVVMLAASGQSPLAGRQPLHHSCIQKPSAFGAANFKTVSGRCLETRAVSFSSGL